MAWGAVSGGVRVVVSAQMYLLGWKAMPFALEDLDSNCV